jgi:peptide deformylase
LIITNINILKQASEPVKDREEAEEIIRKLEQELNPIQIGIGLAAPQIGIHKQVAIIRLRQQDIKSNQDPNKYNVNIINPTEIQYSRMKFVHKNESCLSFPEQFYNIIRHDYVEFMNAWGTEYGYFSITTHGELLTVAVQHEIDHLFGKLIIDPQKIEKIGRNDPCPCGSGKKYKKCCGR